MITLCTAAVGMIYTAGSIATESSKAASTDVTQPGVSSSSTTIVIKTVKSVYKDGTYYGQGRSCIGSVTVAVTV